MQMTGQDIKMHTLTIIKGTKKVLEKCKWLARIYFMDQFIKFRVIYSRLEVLYDMKKNKSNGTI